MRQKLKSFLANDALFYGVLLITVAIASFGLGRQSVLEDKPEKNVANQAFVAQAGSAPMAPTSTPLTETQEVTTSEEVSVGQVVASKSGSKYHLPTCPGAKQIKPENLITFDSPQAAQAAGYTPAANCKF